MRSLRRRLRRRRRTRLNKKRLDSTVNGPDNTKGALWHSGPQRGSQAGLRYKIWVPVPKRMRGQALTINLSIKRGICMRLFYNEPITMRHTIGGHMPCCTVQPSVFLRS